MNYLAFILAAAAVLGACTPQAPSNAGGGKYPATRPTPLYPTATPNSIYNKYPYPSAYPGQTQGQFGPKPTYYPGQPSPTPGIGPVTGSGDCLNADPDTCQAEQQATAMTNQIRGGNPLRHDAKFSAVARYWSQQQANKVCSDGDVICHDGFIEGTRASVYQQMFGSPVDFRRENVGWEMGSASTPLTAVSQLIDGLNNSPGHHANMVANDITVIGNGIYCSNNSCIITQIFGN